MREEAGSLKVGVVVARFQVPDLHEGHLALLSHVMDRHDDVLIVLGTRGKIRTKRDPLSYEEREMMIRQALVGDDFRVSIVSLNDHPFSHERWSKNLDALIAKTYPGRDAVLYGSRKSFIPLYSGAFTTRELPAIPHVSGSEIRAMLPPPRTAKGRAAIIYATEQRRPIMHSVCDLAVIDPPNDRVLLIGKNHHDGLLSFAGGFAEKKDCSALGTAVREGSEEILGIDFAKPVYVGTLVVDDPRFRDTDDGLMGAFYYALYLDGTPRAGDDADRVEWVPRERLMEALVPWHRPFGALLLNSWPKQ